MSTTAGGITYLGHFAIAHTDRTGKSGIVEATPSLGANIPRIVENGECTLTLRINSGGVPDDTSPMDIAA
jgi:hypothetical protein